MVDDFVVRLVFGFLLCCLVDFLFYRIETGLLVLPLNPLI